MAAYRIAQVPEARSAVLSSLAQQEQSVFTDPAPANEGRALSPDGWTLVSAGAGRVTAYDVATGRPVRTFGGIGEAPVTAAMGPDGDTLALAGGGRLELWSLRSGRRLGRGGWMPGAPADYDGRPASLEFSPGGGYIVVRANLGGPYVELSNVARRALEKQDVYVSNARVGPGDRFAALEITEERTVTALRALPGGGTPAGKRLPSRGLQGQVMAISPDGALQTRFTASGSLLLARTGDTVRGWSVPGFTETGRLGVPRKGEPIMRVSPDGRTVVTISSEDLTTGPTFWDTASGRKLGHLTLEPADTRADLQISPDGRLLALSSAMANDYYGAGDVVVIDIARRERVMRFDAVAGRRLGAAWTVTTGAFDPYEPADPMPALAFTWGIRRSPRLAGGLPGPHQHRY